MVRWTKDELEDVMHRFVSGQTDVLVATTIIESGLDIPNANTIIIDRVGPLSVWRISIPIAGPRSDAATTRLMLI